MWQSVAAALLRGRGLEEGNSFLTLYVSTILIKKMVHLEYNFIIFQQERTTKTLHKKCDKNRRELSSKVILDNDVLCNFKGFYKTKIDVLHRYKSPDKKNY